MVEQRGERHISWNREGPSGGLGNGYWERTCYKVVKYKWKVRERPGYGGLEKMKLRLWVRSKTPS